MCKQGMPSPASWLWDGQNYGNLSPFHFLDGRNYGNLSPFHDFHKPCWCARHVIARAPATHAPHLSAMPCCWGHIWPQMPDWSGRPPRLPALQLHHSVLLPTKPNEQAVDTDGWSLPSSTNLPCSYMMDNFPGRYHIIRPKYWSKTK